MRYNILLTNNEIEVREKSVSVFEENDFIGEYLLQTQETYPKRTDTVKARTKCNLLVISRQSFLHLLHDSGGIKKHKGSLFLSNIHNIL